MIIHGEGKMCKKNSWKLMGCAVLLLLGLAAWMAAAGREGGARTAAQIRESAEMPVFIESCRIDKETEKVVVKVSAEGIPESDDAYYYLFALNPYEEEIAEGSPFLRREKEKETVFHTDMKLLCKYVVAVKRDGHYEAVSNPHYITNPEAVSVFVSNGQPPSGKKGLLIDPAKLLHPELEELGIQHAAYNIPVSRILGHDNEDIYEAVHYSYEGKDYVFNGRVMAEYDLIFRTLTGKGIEITAIILNDYSPEYPWLVHPLARSGIGKSPYYAFNGSEGQGAEYLAAIAAFLTERYSGVMNGRGVVSNWVIGNEINARKEWNYMEHVDLETYVREYVRAYRIFYNSIKSVNSACRVYISLDNQWNRVNILTRSYRAKDVLDEFNRQIKEEGNIDWGLAIHPYNKPLTKTDTWNRSFYVWESEHTPVVTMDNIHVVTDYMQRQEFLTDEGQVRPITLSELGYTSSEGEELQAAAIVHAYKVAEANPHIDSVLFSRQTDAEEEAERLRLYLGIDYMDGSHKYAYEVFCHMDTEEGEKYTEFAKDIIGIESWDEVTGK